MSESIPKPQEQPIETQASDVSAGMKRLAKAVNLAALLGVAFVFVDVFESVGKVAESHGRATLHGLIDWLTRWAAIVPGRLSGVTLDLSSKLHPEAFTSLERVVFAIAVGIVALRMFFKTKIIQAIYLESVLSPRRSVAGLLFHFAVFMSFILGLAGVAALVKSGEESVVCLTAALCLVLITVWLIIVHFQVGDEYPHIAWWALNNSLFGLLIIANTLLLPSFNLPMPFSRGGAAALLLLLNSALGLMIGARFVFECESVGRFGRRLGFMVLSLFLIGCVAAFLLTQRV